MTLLSLWLMPALASGSSETEAGLNPIWGTVVSSEVAPQVQPEQVFVASKNPVAPNLSAIQAAPISEPAPEALVEEPAPVLVPRRLQAVLGQAPAEAAPPLPRRPPPSRPSSPACWATASLLPPPRKPPSRPR